jgi:hypothetical protein
VCGPSGRRKGTQTPLSILGTPQIRAGRWEEGRPPVSCLGELAGAVRRLESPFNPALHPPVLLPPMICSTPNPARSPGQEEGM